MKKRSDKLFIDGEDLISLLDSVDISIPKFARQLKLSPPTVYSAVDGNGLSRRSFKRIMEAATLLKKQRVRA